MRNKKIVLGILVLLMANIVYAEIQWGNPAYSGVWTVLNLPVCKTESNGAKYWEQSINGLVDKTYSVDDCYRVDGVDELRVPNDKCCPADKPNCNQVNGDDWICEPGTIPIISCEDYSTNNCGDADAIAETQLTNSNVFTGTEFYCGYEGQIGDGPCIEYIRCVCKVDEDDNNACKPDPQRIIYNWDDGKTYYIELDEEVDYNVMCGASVSPGDCFVDITTVDNCNTTNTKGVSWTVKWIDGATAQPDYCKPGIKEVPCPAQLNFINLASIILAIVLIIILYIIISRKKKAITKKRARVIKKKKRK